MKSRWVNSVDAVPAPVFVAGTKLLPFCLGFHLLFRRFGLPFAGSPAADCLPGSILSGIYLCAQPYGVTLDELHAETWNRGFTKWLGNVMKRRTDPADVEKRFRDYLRDGYSMPPVYKPATGGIALSAPWEQLLRVRLCMCGFTEEEALTGYLPGRWLDYYTAIEILGADKCDNPKHWRPLFITHDDVERIEELRKAQNG